MLKSLAVIFRLVQLMCIHFRGNKLSESRDIHFEPFWASQRNFQLSVLKRTIFIFIIIIGVRNINNRKNFQTIFCARKQFNSFFVEVEL